MTATKIWIYLVETTALRNQTLFAFYQFSACGLFIPAFSIEPSDKYFYILCSEFFRWLCQHKLLFHLNSHLV